MPAIPIRTSAVPAYLIIPESQGATDEDGTLECDRIGQFPADPAICVIPKGAFPGNHSMQGLVYLLLRDLTLRIEMLDPGPPDPRFGIPGVKSLFYFHAANDGTQWQLIKMLQTILRWAFESRSITVFVGSILVKF
jgi:hypothetical protein